MSEEMKVQENPLYTPLTLENVDAFITDLQKEFSSFIKIDDLLNNIEKKLSKIDKENRDDYRDLEKKIEIEISEVDKYIKTRDTDNLKLYNSHLSDSEYLESIKEGDKFIANKLSILKNDFEQKFRSAINPLKPNKYKNTYKERRQQFESNIRKARTQQLRDEIQEKLKQKKIEENQKKIEENQKKIEESKVYLNSLALRQIEIGELFFKMSDLFNKNHGIKVETWDDLKKQTKQKENLTMKDEDIFNLIKLDNKIKEEIKKTTDKINNLEKEKSNLETQQTESHFSLTESFGQNHTTVGEQVKKLNERRQNQQNAPKIGGLNSGL